MGNKNSGRKPDYERRRQMARLRAQGATLEEIGRRLGVTRQAVYDMLRRVRADDARGKRVAGAR